MDERVKELEKALRRFGRHKDQCAAFPATSEEQVARDCDCGLTAALSGAPLRTSRLSDAELLGDPARTVGWPTDQGAAVGRAPEAPPDLASDGTAYQTEAAAAGLPESAAAAPEAGGWAGELGRCDTTQEPHSHRGRLCTNWRPLNPAAPSPRPPEPEGGDDKLLSERQDEEGLAAILATGERKLVLDPVSDDYIERLEREMEDYYSRPATESCYCGRFKLRPGSTLTDSKTWASHRWDRCELKRQPPNATDAEWAEVLCARAVPRRGGMQETPPASPEGPPDPAPAAASAGLRGWFCPDCPMVVRTAVGETCPNCGAELLTPTSWRKMLNDLLGVTRQARRVERFGREDGLRADLAEPRPEFATTAAVHRFHAQQMVAILRAPLPEKQSEARAASAGEGALREALAELLRLYDHRFFLAEREQDPRRTDKKFAAETRRLLNKYGTEKKAAWEAARAALAPAQREGK